MEQQHSQQHSQEINPLRRVDLTKAEIYAIKSVAIGMATAEAQQLAFKTIVEKFCGTYDQPWRSDPSLKDVAIGKRTVGLHLVKTVNVDALGLELDATAVKQLGMLEETEQNDDTSG